MRKKRIKVDIRLIILSLLKVRSTYRDRLDNKWLSEVGVEVWNFERTHFEIGLEPASRTLSIEVSETITCSRLLSSVWFAFDASIAELVLENDTIATGFSIWLPFGKNGKCFVIIDCTFVTRPNLKSGINWNLSSEVLETKNRNSEDNVKHLNQIPHKTYPNIDPYIIFCVVLSIEISHYVS